MQNRAIRNMMKAPRFFRLDNYYLNLRILKVKNLYDLEIAKFMHSHFNNTLPECFANFFRERSIDHSHFTRSSTNIMYETTFYRTARGQRSIRFYGPKIWNEIPASKKNSFKTVLQKAI